MHPEAEWSVWLCATTLTKESGALVLLSTSGGDNDFSRQPLIHARMAPAA